MENWYEKKWGIILGLTGRMLLALQSIYADSTTETTGEVNEKETVDEKIMYTLGADPAKEYS